MSGCDGGDVNIRFQLWWGPVESAYCMGFVVSVYTCRNVIDACESKVHWFSKKESRSAALNLFILFYHSLPSIFYKQKNPIFIIVIVINFLCCI